MTHFTHSRNYSQMALTVDFFRNNICVKKYFQKRFEHVMIKLLINFLNIFLKKDLLNVDEEYQTVKNI